MYNYIGLGLNFEIRGIGIRWNETKHVELGQFLHAFTSRGFDSVSCAFLFYILQWAQANVLWLADIDYGAMFDIQFGRATSGHDLRIHKFINVILTLMLGNSIFVIVW